MLLLAAGASVTLGGGGEVIADWSIFLDVCDVCSDVRSSTFAKHFMASWHRVVEDGVASDGVAPEPLCAGTHDNLHAHESPESCSGQSDVQQHERRGDMGQQYSSCLSHLSR